MQSSRVLGSTLQEARQSLQTAIKQASDADSGATDEELAQHKYRLGRALWAAGGRLRTERGGAHASFLAAAGALDLHQSLSQPAIIAVRIGKHLRSHDASFVELRAQTSYAWTLCLSPPCEVRLVWEQGDKYVRCC